MSEHLNIQTTRGYVTVFDEDDVRHHTAYFTNRRTLRPGDEYRQASTEERQEFEEHFDKRKVELGSCGRPYGTPCQHGHACIRCPMLNVNPKMLDRINEIETDLLARRERAETAGRQAVNPCSSAYHKPHADAGHKLVRCLRVPVCRPTSSPFSAAHPSS
ncbi:integrase [Planomonospora sphaerica]|uniref:Integrase n=1 Tax=Planomonospora sphaerica TaxID=161355 RepID=A0A161MCR1_9ACTN|nr:hypothetical protein [Planomonospora sphaerica]GAT69083.1 integrase [Planomonospora sphaerica]